MRLTLICICTFKLFFLYAQIPVSAEDENRTFVRLVIASKNYKINSDSLLFDALHQSGVPSEKFAQIIKSGMDRQTMDLNDAEKNLLTKIKKVKAQIAEINRQYLEKKCAAAGLKFDRYLELKQKYRTDLVFQQALIPYFVAESESK